MAPSSANHDPFDLGFEAHDDFAPTGGDPIRVDRYRRAPWFHVMEWWKPG